MLVKQIALCSKNVRFTDHAEERMEERDISLHDVFRVLQKGSVYDVPRPGKKKGEWICKIERHARGNRDIGVVSVIVREEHLLILTVEWEDL